MLVITMQYPLGIPPNLRTNIDYVFILREPYISNRRRIYDTGGHDDPSLCEKGKGWVGGGFRT